MATEPPDLRNDPLYLKVYTLLKEWIICGRLAPGERIGETALAAELHVSRTPVRDALRRLEQNRLIIQIQGSAYEVYRPTFKDVEDFYTARSILEGGAARLAALREPAATADQMAALLEQMQQSYLTRPPEVLLDLDTQFHECLVNGSGNPVLVELHSHLSTRLRHLRSMSGDITTRQQRVLEQHGAIVAAVRRGDGAAAEEATRSHILSVFSTVRETFLARSVHRS